MPSREAHLRTEVMFRSINERIRELAARFQQAPADPLDFVCECADEACVERIPLTTEQFDDIRADPAHFAVVPGHEATPLVERVIHRNEHFVVVQKVDIDDDTVRELS